MGEIYLEIMPLENALRVTAVDAETAVEVVFAAPSYASKDRIERLARNKLARRLKLDQSPAGQGRGASGVASSAGKLV